MGFDITFVISKGLNTSRKINRFFQYIFNKQFPAFKTQEN